MPRHRFFRRFHSTPSTSVILSKQSKKTSKHKTCAIVTKYLLQASIPLTIAIFTIVTYLQDVKIAELARDKDWKIARTGLDIANETRLQDLRIANETRIHDRQLVQEQREEDHQQQLDLHHQTLYSRYMDDISSVLYKQPQNHIMFLNEDAKYLYIRRKTLMTLREIDSVRRGLLFIFLYENKLLPDRTKPKSTVSLTGADLHNITVKSPLIGKYVFNSLLLETVYLVNSTFINCIFTGGVHFIGSAMSNVSFINSRFECEGLNGSVNIFDQVSLDYSKFRNTFLCTTRFTNSNLSTSIFDVVTMQQVSFIKTNLINALLNVSQKGIIRLSNVMLPNGTNMSTVITKVSSCARWNRNATTIAGAQNGVSGSNISMLHTPIGIVIDMDDHNTFYVIDSGNKRVIKFRQGDSRGEVIMQGLSSMRWIDIDNEQNLYITDGIQVIKFLRDSRIGVTFASYDSISSVSKQLLFGGIMLNEKKQLYISDTDNHRILMWTPNAESGISIAGVIHENGSNASFLSYPQAVFVDSLYDSLYVSDAGNHRIQRFHPIGNRTGETIAGSGVHGTQLHQLAHPRTVTVLFNQDIYILEKANGRIVRWTLGNYSAGGTCIVNCAPQSGFISGPLPDKLIDPSDFKFDSDGNIIVSDSGNNRIQKFELINNQC